MSMANSGATIPYQLRHHKAIERNLFLDLLKRLNAYPEINLKEYKYVGFGAAFLEDFKLMHLEFGMTDMDSIEGDKYAYTRQVFNNPYHFINPIPCYSSVYLADYYNPEKPMVIWFDYASPGQLREQLLELEDLATKVLPLDILKFTFNAKIGSFADTFKIDENPGVQLHQAIVNFLNDDETFKNYVPPGLGALHFAPFDKVIRSMALRAIYRGLNSTGKNYKFNLLSAFRYADGQTMTTMTGIITENEDQFKNLLETTKLQDWPFYKNYTGDIFDSINISVPSMTVIERASVDKKFYSVPPEQVHGELEFKYGASEREHAELIAGYHKFYKYLPYYGKVIY